MGGEGAQDLANALQVNKVTTILLPSPRHFTSLLITLFTQTLTALTLEFNRIGDEGAQDFASALQRNKTLTTLKLRKNQIGADACKRLRKVCENNTELIITLDGDENIFGDVDEDDY
ncbi:unnamed protein product [Adineta steineri]|uniref:Uncharacterized protein n=1 Tax=Adineta steineri TaxID=433720 RepID=A0A814M1X0_9BILA|nr:unnamed protein product [Adineta steineri]CAF1107177.1 unnamed protein product [Adineta steineri]CAF1169101.1 unnamed protein product [Adineta steineri]CAF3566289.1 unnamed protein product [Adineta steineri]CAF3660621.1 unnamed protein product [Adineta steineri]